MKSHLQLDSMWDYLSLDLTRHLAETAKTRCSSRWQFNFMFWNIAVYNPGHNVLELYNILIRVRFPTSKTKLDIQYRKLGIRVASRVPERVKT